MIGYPVVIGISVPPCVAAELQWRPHNLWNICYDRDTLCLLHGVNQNQKTKTALTDAERPFYPTVRVIRRDFGRQSNSCRQKKESITPPPLTPYFKRMVGLLENSAFYIGLGFATVSSSNDNVHTMGLLGAVLQHCISERRFS